MYAVPKSALTCKLCTTMRWSFVFGSQMNAKEYPLTAGIDMLEKAWLFAGTDVVGKLFLSTLMSWFTDYKVRCNSHVLFAHLNICNDPFWFSWSLYAG